MPEAAIHEITGCAAADHPAVKAWRALRPQGVEPTSVEIVQEWSGDKKSRRSGVYRLRGVGVAGGSIIAKRSRKKYAAVEVAVYEDFLARLENVGVRYFGSVEERDDVSTWVFLEDAGNENFSSLREEDLVLAARWMGHLHTSASAIAASARLPDRGPGYYLTQLRSARERIEQNITAPTLTAEDVSVLEAIDSRFERLESVWTGVEEICAAMPRTLIHGDFRQKNVRVRVGRAGLNLVAFDWEDAGWGVPALDVAHLLEGRAGVPENPVAAAYSATIRGHCPNLGSGAVERLARCGALLRSIDRISHASWGLVYEWGEWPMSHMRRYGSMLARVDEVVE